MPAEKCAAPLVRRLVRKRCVSPVANTNTHHLPATRRRLETLSLFQYSVPTPLGPFLLFTDEDGAVRTCMWQTSAPDEAETLEAEVQRRCDDLQQRWYRDTTIDVTPVSFSPTLSTTAQSGPAPGMQAATLLHQYFNPPAGTSLKQLQLWLDAIPVAYPTTATPFVLQAWKVLREGVMAGETITYKGLGERVAKAADYHRSGAGAAAPRAIGAAMGSNPIPIIIPCHRVLSTGQALRGYGLGLRFKVWLLRHEQADVPHAKLLAVENENAISTKAALH